MAAARLACRKATDVTGAAAVGVRNSNHCGSLAWFVRDAASQGLVAVAMSNATASMTYHGGRSPAVGTNPIAIAVPRQDSPPIVLDMATSAAARGRIIAMRRLGQAVPEGWAIDAAGRPTTDAASALAGSVLPFAGPKGSGLAMMIDICCGLLLGGPTGGAIGDMYENWTRPQGLGQFFIVLDPDAWIGRAAFAAMTETFAASVHDLPPAVGFERVALPGEIEDACAQRAARDGITLPAAVVDDLDALVASTGAAHLSPLPRTAVAR
jgi:LDH2 family malate/lactate/ureidoglycolate dehydrogenase